MRIIFLATGAFAQPTLRWLTESDHEVTLVVTQPARGRGRGRHVARTPVKALADELGLETAEVEDVNSSETIEVLQPLAADLGLVIAFGQKIGDQVGGLLRGGCVNLHASLLPKYRGAAPINWAVVHGERRTGCTVFRIVERMDAGPILATTATDIRPEETAGELHDRLAILGVDTVATALEMFDGGRVPAGTPQNDNEATRARKLVKSDGFVDFHRPAPEVAAHVHGMTPWPGAAARLAGTDGRWENVALVRVRPHEAASVASAASAASPGTIDHNGHIAVEHGSIEILEIKPASGRLMSWPDYVNGRHVQQGDRFLTPSG